MVRRLLSRNSMASSVKTQQLVADSTASAAEVSALVSAVEPARVGAGWLEQGWRPFSPRFEDDSSALARLTKLAALPEAERTAAIQKTFRPRTQSVPPYSATGLRRFCCAT